MGFGALKIEKIAYFTFRGYIFTNKLKSFGKPIRMAIERLKFKILAFGTFTHARDIIFTKYRLISESRFIIKMCPFSVQNDKICSEQMFVFVNVFGYDTNIHKIFKNIIWPLVSLNRQKYNSRRVHIMIAQHMVMKMPTCIKFNNISIFLQ